MRFRSRPTPDGFGGELLLLFGIDLGVSGGDIPVVSWRLQMMTTKKDEYSRQNALSLTDVL